MLLVEGKSFSDERGTFLELYSVSHNVAGIRFVQDNYSRSKKGVLRGLHFQEPNGQGKLVQVVRGSVYDVAVDIRRGSPHFGKWFGTILSEENHLKMWIPAGFAHGFYAITEADFVYKCSELYIAEYDRAIRYNDPAIGVDWPVLDPILSAKDQTAPLLADAEVLPQYA